MSVFTGKGMVELTTTSRGTVDVRPLLSRWMASLTLALLLVSVGSAAYGIFSVVYKGSLHDQVVVWSACGVLICLAILLMLLGRHSLHRSLGHLEQQLRTLAREDRLDEIDGPIPDELKPVMETLRGYVKQVLGRVDRLRLRKKELNIQMRAAEAERKHTEAIIFSISDAVLVVDSYGELVLANTAAELVFDFSLEKSRRHPIERVLGDSSLVDLIKSARTCSDRSVRRELKYSRLQDGKTQVFLVTLSRVVDAAGQARGIVAVFHDVTREREIAQIKTDFVSAVSHELRTPLSSIKAYVEMLIDDEAHDADTRNDFYRIIESETERLQRLVGNILDISRIESGVADMQKETIHPREIAAEVLDVMTPQAREKGITLEGEWPESLPPIYANRDLLYQAVTNLVGNAVKYTPDGGHVRVCASVDEQNARYVIAVIDNGIGISVEDLPRIFDKFYRTAQGSVAAGGTGLGLNLVRQIVETVHHGDISVTSERDVGTTVVVRLPLMTG